MKLSSQLTNLHNQKRQDEQLRLSKPFRLAYNPNANLHKVQVLVKVQLLWWQCCAHEFFGEQTLKLASLNKAKHYTGSSVSQ